MKADQDRVKALLAESITVLCKNGLSYKNRFTIQGLLGITLDDEEVFLIDIHEKIGESHPIATWSAKERDFDGQKPQRNVSVSSSPEPPIKRKRRHSESGRSVSPLFDTSQSDRNTVRPSNIENRVTEGVQGDGAHTPSHKTFQPFTEPLSLSQPTVIPNTNTSVSDGQEASGQTDSSVRLPGEECGLEMSVDVLRGDIEQSIQDLNDLVSQSQTIVTESRSRTERLPKRLDSGSGVRVKTEKLDDIFIVKEESSGSDSHVATETRQSGQFTYEAAQPGCSNWTSQEDSEFQPDFSAEQAGDHEETQEDRDRTGKSEEKYKIPAAGLVHGPQDVQMENTVVLEINTRWQNSSNTFSMEDREVQDVVPRGQSSGSCQECRISFESINDLKLHVEVFHEGKRFTCEHENCGQRFKNNFLLEQHQMTHTGIKPHVCQVCEKAFNRASSLNRHRILVHQAPFSCEVCKRTFSSKRTLKTHLENHFEQKPWVCQNCGNRFKYLHLLKQHQLTHTGFRPFDCEVCGNKFSRESSLKRHKRLLHQDSLSCGICRQRFSTKEILKQHITTHGDRGPFACQDCGRGFSCQGTLTKHKLIHKQGPYRCTVCGASFTQAQSLLIHVNTHTPGNVS